MFEGIVASLLNRYLSNYIDEVDYNNLKLGLFSGTLELLNIKVKPSALYQFDLPVDVKYGKIGKLKINISWKNILTKPAVANVEDLFVLLAPFEDKINDPKKIEEMLFSYKRKQLQEFEKFDKAEIYETKEKGFAERAQDTIINNIQVYVKNIHIRYEDKHSIQNKIISFGLYFKEFTAETVDADDKPNFLTSDEKTIYKKGSLVGFNSYWNYGEDKNSLIILQANDSDPKKQTWSNHLKDSIDTGVLLNTPFVKFMENNLDLNVRLTLRRSHQGGEDADKPKVTVESSLKSLGFVFQRQQYKSILQIVDYYSLLSIHKKFVKYRPKEFSKISKEKAKQMWNFAFTALAETTWRSYKKERMLYHWKHYKMYIIKYEQKIQANQKNKILDQKDIELLEFLEKTLTLESILDVRNMLKDKYKIKSDEQPEKELQTELAGARQISVDQRPINYIEFRLVLKLPLITLKLTNAGYLIMKATFRNIESLFEIRPVSNSVYFVINCQCIELDGIYYKESLKTSPNKLVPIVKSDSISKPDSISNEVNLLPVEDAKNRLFTFCIETNPPTIEDVEFRVRSKLSSVEVYYEKTFITELLRFFRTDLIDFEEVKKIREVWSKAGVIYAVENHKQFYIDAELSSPYFIIPIKGTCTDRESPDACSIVFYLGNTTILSHTQTKKSNYQPTDIKDLENNFYDKLNLNVTDIQVLLIPSRLSYKEYLRSCFDMNYKYHLIYPISTENTLYLSINPSYKKLAKMKLDAVCSSIRFNFSDRKIIMLAEFAQNFPLPEMPKTVVNPNATIGLKKTGGNFETLIGKNPNPIKLEHDSNRYSVDSRRSHTSHGDSRRSNTSTNDPFGNVIVLPTKSAMMQMVEPDDEWDGPFNLPLHINGDPIPNYPQILAKFKINDFSIDLNSSSSKSKSNNLSSISDRLSESNEYLSLVLNDIYIDFSITKYGLCFRAGLGDLKLIDKIHLIDKQNKKVTEILSSSGNFDQLIKFYFRQVEEEAPNFTTLYSNILKNVLFECNDIHVACHRTAIVYFLEYVTDITDNLNIANKKPIPIEVEVGGESVVSQPVDDQNKHRASIVPTVPASVAAVKKPCTTNACELNLIAKMNQLTWNMFDSKFTFGQMLVKELSVNYNLSGIKTNLNCQLKKILIDYGNEVSECYKQIISCTGDGTSTTFFDLNLTLYDTSYLSEDEISKSKDELSDSLKLVVGKIKVICLVKFVNELVSFFDPIINPLPAALTEQVKEQALEAVKSAYQEQQSVGKKMYINIHITSPQVIIPQNSRHLHAFLVDLGNLNLSNRFLDVSSALGVSSLDEISFRLDNLEIKRIVFEKNTGSSAILIKEQLMQQVNMSGQLKRTLKNVDPLNLPDIDIFAQLNDMECFMSLKSAKLLFAILNENLNESSLDQTSAPKKNEYELHASSSPSKRASIQPNSQQVKPFIKRGSLANIKEIEVDRINMQLIVDLKRIKLIIVELISNKDANSASSGAIVDIVKSGDDLIKPDQINIQRMNNSYKIINFGHLEIQDVDFNYYKNENLSWYAEFKMKELKLNDVRPDSNLAVKEMFIPLSKENYFIEVNYKVDKSQNANLDFTLSHLKINLCLPYVLKLYQIAMDAIAPSKENPQTSNDSKSQKIKNAIAENTEILITPPVNQSVLKVVGKIELPEVVLFAEPEKTNSKTLIMNTELNLRFESNSGVTDLEINLADLGLRLGENMNSSKRQGIPFLNPCSANIYMRQTDPTKPAQYNAYIDSLYLNMTPTMYEVVMGVVNTINKTGTETIEKETETKRLLEDAEPFVKHKINHDKYNYLNLVRRPVSELDETIQSEDAALATPAPEQVDTNKTAIVKLLETLELSINELYITFCEETGLDLQPLAIVKLKLNGRVSNWTRNLHLKATLSLEASYYNDRLSSWEPLVENCMQQEDVYRPWLLAVWFAMEPGGILQPPVDQKGIRSIDFPVQDLDYSPLNSSDSNAELIKTSSNVRLEPVPSESIFNDEMSAKGSKLSKPNRKQHKQQAKQKKAQITLNQLEAEENRNRNTPIASYVLIESNDILNVNVTPSAYRVIMYLAQITAGTSNKDFLENKVKPPLKFLNFLGENCDLFLARYLDKDHAVGFNLIAVKDESESLCSSPTKKTIEQRTQDHRIQKIVDESQHSQVDTVYNESYKFKIGLFGFEKCKLSMKNDGSYLINLRESQSESEKRLPGETIKYNLLFKVRTLYGRTKIILSSPLLIENNTKVKLYILVELNDRVAALKESLKQNLHLYEEVKFEDNREFSIIFELLPGKIYYVPLTVAYNFKLYTTPNSQKYQPSLIFDIRGYNLRIDECTEVNCKRTTGVERGVAVVGSGEEAETVFDNDFYLTKQLCLNVRSKTNVIPAMHANYRVSLNSPINLSNCLPLAIRFDVHDQGQRFSTQLEPGENLNIHLSCATLRQCKVHVINYLNTSWVGEIDWLEFTEFKQEILKLDMRIAPTTEMQVSGKHLRIYVSYKKPNEFMIYSPYWLVNKSGQPIKIKSSDTHRIFDIPDDCILFFDYKTISKSNKVKMTVRNGRWSSDFSLETAGTTGMIQCKDDNKTYNFLMRITMSNSSRSKLITFAPFLSIANQLDQTILIREWHKSQKSVSNYDWKPIESIDILKKPVSYWPNFAGESKQQVCFVIKNPNGFETQPFPLENPGRFVLMVKNFEPTESLNASNNANDNAPNSNESRAEQYKILTVLISGGNQNPVTIVIRKYQYGDSVAKIVNLCQDLTINLKQRSSDPTLAWQLEPMKDMFFVWPDLIKPNRDLYWNLSNVAPNSSQQYEPIKLTKSGNDKYRFDVPALDNHSSSTRVVVPNEPEAHDDTNNLLLNTSISANAANSLKQVEISCVSYIDATQRVIVFTTDMSLAEVERKKESSTMEIFLALQGVEMSLINNVNLEIATISLKDSSSNWSLETETNELKVFTNEYSVWLEKNYLQYLNEKSFIKMNTLNSIVYLTKDGTNQNQKFEIDFKNMKLIKPEKGQLKREWSPGLAIQYRTSANMTSLKCCVYNFQMDNQLPDAYFPISFYRSTKQKDENSQLVPFTSISLFTELQEVTQIYRYFDCILQEFYLKMDKGFLLSIKDWYDAAIETSSKDDKTFDLSSEDTSEILNYIFIVDQNKYLLEKMTSDLKLTKEIMEYANQTGSVKQSAHIRFDDFYLSPILFNLSFSVNGTAHTDDKEVKPGTADTILNFFLESIGATITEFKDVKFRFKSFTINNLTITWKELYDELFDHYKIQTLHQAYVLILGLDVLGNPFGLVSDFSQGLQDLFYDPLLGYFTQKGNSEPIQFNISNKVRSTVNQTISSVAGSGSLISGSIGRVLATVTFDSEYKKKRQYKLSKTTTTSLPDSLTIAGKGVVSGLVYGLTGVVKKPMENRSHGVKGIFIGVGKGLTGLFAKPVGSVFDGLSLSLDSLKRFAQSGSEPTVNMRLPRHLINDVAILPFSEYQAKGYEILRDLNNDDIALSESYWAHIFIETKHLKSLLFITDRNIFKLKKTRTQILKKWQVLEKPIALSKIQHVKIEPFNVEETIVNRIIRKKIETTELPVNTKDTQMYRLYVYLSDDLALTIGRQDNISVTGNVTDELLDENKKHLLITSDLNTCNWINDKINSAIKYYKELKNILDIA